MRVLRRVAVGVMHPMHDCIGLRAQITGPLNGPRQEMKSSLPPLAHRELAMRAISMQEETLEKNRQLPMQDEEQENSHDEYVRPLRSCRRHGSVMSGHRLSRFGQLTCDDGLYARALGSQPRR